MSWMVRVSRRHVDWLRSGCLTRLLQKWDLHPPDPALRRSGSSQISVTATSPREGAGSCRWLTSAAMLAPELEGESGRCAIWPGRGKV